METKIINTQFLNDGFTQKDYDENRTLLLQSTTGTGKTFTVMNYIKEDLEHKSLLCIFGKQSLGKQILKYFKKYNKSYKKQTNHYEINKKTFNQNFTTQSSFVCINSLMNILDKDRYNDKFMNAIKNKIVYIDEISIFISECINNNLIKNLFEIYYLLKYILLFSYKVIVSQSEISESVFQLLNGRLKDCSRGFDFINKSLYVVNQYRKVGAKAVVHEDKNDFLAKIMETYDKGEYFLVACDAKEVITKIHKLFIDRIEEKHQKQTYLFTSTRLYTFQYHHP